MAEKAILIDILTGIISPLDDGDLVISMFALNKVAQSYGLTLTGANLSWEDLLKIYQANPNAKIIAHVQGNHYLVIQSITANSITYMDPGKGKDKQNEVITLAKKDFLKSWKGNVTLEQTKLQSVASYQTKTLSAEQTKNIRGAFFFLLIPAIIGALASIGAAIGAVLASIGAMIATAGTLIGNIFIGLGQIIGGVFQGIGYLGHALFEGIHMAASGLFHAIGNVGSYLSQSSFGSLAKATFGQNLFNAAVRTGLSFATSKGLESLGVDPAIANIASAFVTGSFHGLTTNITAAQTAAGITRSAFLASSVFQSVAVAGIGQLGPRLGLSPELANILSLSVAAIGGNILENPGTTLAQAFSNVKPELIMSLARYGVDKVGTSMGLDPSLRNLIGAPIANIAGLSFNSGKDIGATLVQNIQEGLFKGAIAYGVDFASKHITDNAILASLSSRVLTGAIEGSLLQKGVFKGVYDALKQSVLGVLGIDQKDSLIKTIQFGSLVAANGLKNALEVHLTSIFNQQSVDSIQRAGGIAYALASPKTEITMPDGNKAFSVSVSSGEGILFDSQNKLLGFERNGVYQTGEFGVTSTGAFGLINGTSLGQFLDGSVYEITIQNEKVIQSSITMSDNARLDININGSQDEIRFDADGRVIDGEIVLDNRARLVISNGTLDSVTVSNNTPFYNPMSETVNFGQRISSALSQDSRGQEGDNSQLIEEIKEEITTHYIFGNGFENEVRYENTPDPLMEAYIRALELRDHLLTAGNKAIVYLYEMTDMIGNAMDWLREFKTDWAFTLNPFILIIDTLIDKLTNGSTDTSSMNDEEKVLFYKLQESLRNFSDATGIGNNLVREVIEELERAQKTKGRIKDGIAFTHSGFTAPILSAIQEMQYDVNTVIIYEGPHPNYYQQFTNPNLQRVIHVMGSNHGILNSIGEGDSPVPFLNWAHFTNPANTDFKNINIEIKGAWHNDYSYNEVDWVRIIQETYDKHISQGAQIADIFVQEKLKEQEKNRKVNLFMRDLYEASKHDDDLTNFLKRNDIGRDLETGIYKIDLDIYQSQRTF